MGRRERLWAVKREGERERLRATVVTGALEE